MKREKKNPLPIQLKPLVILDGKISHTSYQAKKKNVNMKKLKMMENFPPSKQEKTKKENNFNCSFPRTK